jgi:hypothetical protein
MCEVGQCYHTKKHLMVSYNSFIFFSVVVILQLWIFEQGRPKIVVVFWIVVKEGICLHM